MIYGIRLCDTVTAILLKKVTVCKITSFRFWIFETKSYILRNLELVLGFRFRIGNNSRLVLYKVGSVKERRYVSPAVSVNIYGQMLTYLCHGCKEEDHTNCCSNTKTYSQERFRGKMDFK